MGHIVNSIDIKTLLRDARKDLAETLQALRVSEARSRSQAEQLRALSDELSTILNTAGIGITRCSRDLATFEPMRRMQPSQGYLSRKSLGGPSSR